MVTCRRMLVVLALVLVASGGMGAQEEGQLYQQYVDTAGRIIGAALTDTGGWDKLAYLCDRIGNRLSGSPGLEKAVTWASDQMKTDELENVRTLPVKVPHWVRGRESAEVVEPVPHPLSILGLGGSVGTPPEGITASVVVVSSFDELKALGREKVEGKMVLYDVPFTTYGQTVDYRVRGASEAASLGAVAMLLRSVTPLSLYTPHTGMLSYRGESLPFTPRPTRDTGTPPSSAEVPRIPAAAITIEDAAWIHRLVVGGVPVKVHLQMEAQTLPEVDSADVLGEIVGREKPEEVVVIGGHIDSWDVGQGANDDGAGIVVSMQALTLLKKLGLRPRRTLRVVLWTNEENGVAGGRTYRQWVGEALKDHVASIEADSGGERPTGFGLGLPTWRDRPEGPAVKEQALVTLRQISRLLDGIDVAEVNDGGGGTDIGPLMLDGVPGLGLRTVGTHYFEWHHTNADTLDKIQPNDLRRQIAAMAVMAYVLADMPGRLVEPAPPPATGATKNPTGAY